MKRFIVLLALVFLSFPARAEIALIRDAEIENILKSYADPVFSAAGLNPDAIKIYIVNDKSINAFVAGGQNLFLNTGLILKCENANMLIGVIAHETGHISSGHVIKRTTQAEGLSMETALATVLGAAVSVAGLPEAGIAVMAGGQHVAQRQFLKFSREQEVEADQRGLEYLGRTHQTAEGMLDILQILRRQQTLEFGQVDQYAISHPLTQERIAHIRSQVAVESNIEADHFKPQHDRMVAKLYGFLEKPTNTFMKYNDDSVPSHYARAVAYYRNSELDKSFAELDTLIASAPEDPFFNELKGQFLSESGKLDQALPYYLKADEYYRNSFLIKFEIGKLYLAKEDVDNALKYLTRASQIEQKNSEVWRMLAGVYNKKNNAGMMNLALAEAANLQDQNSQARGYAREAKKQLAKNSPAWIRANDILADIKIKKDDEE